MTARHTPQPGALAGVRVLNVGQILAAPFWATLLAEFGADVIKLERPGGEPNHASVSFDQDNRGQRGITLDLAVRDGKALFRRLCAAVDILIENYRPGTLEKLELAPDSLRETNPGLIAVRVSGYGQTGPYRERAGFDRVALGFGGVTYTTGTADGPPVRPGYMIADYGAGLFAAFGALAALKACDQTGLGQDVDVALYEAVWRMSGTHAANYGLSGENRERSGNYYPGVVPAEQFETADGEFLILNATTQRVFERLSDAIGQPDLVQDELFDTRSKLRANHEAIHAILRDWIAQRSLDECQRCFDEYGVPATKVYATSDIVADPHYAARDQVLTVESPQHGELLQPGIVPRLTATPGAVPRPAPTLGQHNDEVYAELLGLSQDEIDAGLIFFNGVSATNAVREGARCGVVGHTQAAIEDRVRDASTMGDPTSITVEAFETDGTPIGSWPDASVGDDLVVTAIYEHPWILPLDSVVGGLTTFTRTDRMRVEATAFDKPD